MKKKSSQDNEETAENQKRDWSQERKEGESSENNEDESKDASKATDDNESKENKDGDSKDDIKKDSDDKKDSSKTPVKKSEARHAESRYSEVPMNQMFCHVCNKHMWDGSVIYFHYCRLIIIKLLNNDVNYIFLLLKFYFGFKLIFNLI